MAVKLHVLPCRKDRRDHVLYRGDAPHKRRHRIDEEDRALAIAFQQLELVRDTRRAIGRETGDRAREVFRPIDRAGAVRQGRGVLGIDGQVDARHDTAAVALRS